METRRLIVDPERPDPGAIRDAAGLLLRHECVAFATETVYGLGALADEPEAVARIFEAKGRPSNNPLIVHIGRDRAMLDRVVAGWTPDAQTLADAFWPGPLTLILPRSPNIPDLTTAGQRTVGVRMPAHRVALSLIEYLGRPLAAPSANRSNRISPTTADHVLASLDGRIPLVLDSGPARVGLESTVLDLSGEMPRILRPGMVGADAIEAALGKRILFQTHATPDSGPIKSPGQLPIHYAPRKPAFRLERPVVTREWDDLSTTTIVIGPEMAFGQAGDIVMSQPVLAASRLYEILHAADRGESERILVVMPPDSAEWLAVRDRLLRATTPWG